MNAAPSIERHLIIRDDGDVSLPALTRMLFSGKECESGFVGVAAPVPPKFDTRLTVQRKGAELVIAALLSTAPRRLHTEDPLCCGSVEISFDLRNDGFGFVQFIFQEGASVTVNDFSPYPEAKSTRWKLPRVKRWGFEAVKPTNPTYFGTSRIVFYAAFRESEIFSCSPTVGFNVCREDQVTGEFSSWNFLAGCGAPDATSLGKLHRSQKAKAIAMTPAHCPPRVSEAPAPFRLSVTNDTPMMVCGGPYTPDTLDSEMRILKSWGINRLHWIDYSNFPAFWTSPSWRENFRKTQRACGDDLLAAACNAARRHRIELVPDFKIFDIGFAGGWEAPNVEGRLPFVKGMKSIDILGIPEMQGHEDAFMQTNPAWRRKTAYPIETLRLFSSEPLPELTLADIQLSQSVDNAHYASLGGRTITMAVRQVARPNLRWTPAGNVREKGTHRAWMLELRGLSIAQPYLGIEIKGARGINGALTNFHFALVEAIGADGREVPFSCAGPSPAKFPGSKYHFFRKWPGWNNHNEPAVARISMPLSGFGITFIEPPALTGMLEPTHPTAQKIWLDRVEWYLEHDIPGIGIRSLCHHYHCGSWLQYAFAPSVISEFERQYGRKPEAGEEDYARIRLLRGEALGAFLSEARARIRKNQKKLIFQIECGSELPAANESRMAIYADYEKWIASGLFDELHARAITGHSPWLRNVILPLAHKHGVEVHLITRNQSKGLDIRDCVETQRMVSDARQMGYHGLNFYESANLYEIGADGIVLPRAMAEPCLKEAARLANC